MHIQLLKGLLWLDGWVEFGEIQWAGLAFAIYARVIKDKKKNLKASILSTSEGV